MIGYEHTGVRSFFQGLLLGHPIHTISYTIPPLPTAPLKKGNSQMESSVQDNPAAPPPCQYTVRPARMRSSIPLLEPGPPRFFFGGMKTANKPHASRNYTQDH